MSYQVQPDKRRRRKFTRPLLFLALLLALTGGGMKFGIIPGGEAIFGKDGIILPDSSPAITEAEPRSYDIVVSEDVIEIDGEAVTLDELNTIFLKASEVDTFRIRDDQAIKETFEAVIEAADKHQLDYQLIE